MLVELDRGILESLFLFNLMAIDKVAVLFYHSEGQWTLRVSEIVKICSEEQKRQLSFLV
jgi:hypothetical protein